MIPTIYLAIINEDKFTEIFCLADDFCNVFEVQMRKTSILLQINPVEVLLSCSYLEVQSGDTEVHLGVSHH